jgi:hypothetical protein
VKKMIAVTLMLGAMCAAGVAAGGDKLEDMVQAAREKVKVTRSYEVGTTANFVLAQDEAALLEFKENPAGVEEYLFWYDGEKVHIFSTRAGKDEGEHTYMTLKRRWDYQIKGARDLSWVAECNSSWEPRDGKAAVSFCAQEAEDPERAITDYLSNLARRVKELVTVRRSYEVGTTASLVLGPDEAALLEFRENPGALKDFLFWYAAEELHFTYSLSGERYDNHIVLARGRRMRDQRTVTARGASGLVECTTEWEPRDGKAAVTFSGKEMSRQQLKNKMEKMKESQWKKAGRVLEWDYEKQISPVKIIMDDPDDPNMVKLRTEYKLGKLVSGAADEYEKLRLLTKWVHDQWTHTGNNKPSKSDPLTILKEAGEGEKFRCVEYSIVVAGCARSLGMPSRVLALKREDVETAKSGAGHVVAEVWLDQFKKWVFVDGQMDAIPEENGVPLNAVEFQEAVARKAKDRDGVSLKIRSSSMSKSRSFGFAEEDYILWAAPYLYHFDFNLDQRFFGESYEERRYSPVKGKIMLVPKGAKNPTVFQQKTPIENCTYISNPKAFYPDMMEERGNNPAEAALHSIMKDGKWGFVDKEGTIVIEPRFDAADSRGAGEGLIAVEVDGKWGFINSAGEMVVEPQFDHACYFREGLAPVKVGRKWGCIDASGKMVIEPQFDIPLWFSQGLARVKVGGRWWYIDRSGKDAFPARFDFASGFSQGLAAVKVGDKWGYVDRTGDMAIEPTFSHAFKFSSGLAVAKAAGKAACIDRTGKAVIDLDFDGFGDFSEGLMQVEVGRKWGWINDKGDIVIKPQYDLAGSFVEGLAVSMNDGKYGYVDKAGDVVIPFRYDAASAFRGGLAKVKMGDEWKLIDKTGRFLWESTQP